MHMTLLDWTVVAVVLAIFVAIALCANRLTKSVADYLVAGRTAGRYILTVSAGNEWIGVIAIAAMFELYYKSGLPGMWWVMLASPVIAYLQISGWGMYRFRETRAMTVAEYLEMRYSRSTRIWGAAISWFAGMINFGFFPLISAKFLIALIGLPAHFQVAGFTLPTYPVVTAITVVLPLVFVLFGGHLTVLVSDFTQGLFMNIAALALLFTVLSTAFHWDQVIFSLKAASHEGSSLINPLNTSDTRDFNAWYFILAMVTAYYSIMSNVAAQGFQGSAKNSHELRMGNLLGQIRWQGLLIFFMIFVLVVITYMHHPAYASTAASINHTLDVATGNQNLTSAERTQMLVPAALSYMLPHGMIGLFCSIMVAALISSSNAFMHAWGSVFLQDIVLPFRRKPLSTRHHLWALRFSVLGVAIIAFLLSLTIVPRQSILMYFALFNNLWLGPAGTVILGGLYWKRGTTRAAITTLIAGMIVSGTLIVLSQSWGHLTSTYTSRSFSDPATVIVQLQGGTRPLDRFVWQSFSSEERAALSQPELGSSRAAGILAQSFDKLAKGGRIYEQGRFHGINIPSDTAATLGQATLGIENRRVLSIAYPSIAAEETFPINGQWSYFLTILFCIALYTAVSLLDAAPAHNMEKLLRRGTYAIPGESPTHDQDVSWWQRLFGITRMFTREDRITAYIIIGYFQLSFVTFVIGTTYGWLQKPSDDAWAHFWSVYLSVQLLLLVGSTLWLGIGGIRDLRRLVHSMRTVKRDFSDIGEMQHNVPAEAPAPAEQAEPLTSTH